MKFVYHYSAESPAKRLSGIAEMDFKIRDKEGYQKLKMQIVRDMPFPANNLHVISLTLLHEEIYP